jgi:Spore germination protein.
MQGMTKEKINAFHLALFVYMCELDGTVFSLARSIAENIGTNGWVALFLLSPIALLNILLYHILFRAGEGRSAFELLEGTFPKWLLFPFYAVFAAHWIWLGAIIGKHFLLIYQTFAFQTTSPTMMLLLYCLIVYTLLIKDIYSILKAVTVFFIFTCSLNMLIPYFFRDLELVRFTSSFFQGAEKGHSFHGWLEVYLVFVGFEVILFLFPQLDKKGRTFRGAYYGHLLITSVYIIAVIIAFGFFSFKEVQSLQYPLISTLEYIELPFLNRVENLIFTVFLFTNLVSTLSYGYAGKVTLQRIVPKVPDKLLSVIIVAAVFVSGSLLRILRDTEEWLEIGLMTEVLLSFAMPLFLIPVALYQKKNRKERGGSGG